MVWDKFFSIWPMIICIRKKGHYNYRRICEIMTLNEIHYNPATSTYLSVVCLVLKNPHTQNMLLHIESTGRYTHYKQVKVVHNYIGKESWRFAKSKSSCLSYSVVVSLPLESILSKISRYEADLSVSVVSFISSLPGYMKLWWHISAPHLSDNYVDLSDNYVDLSDDYVDLSDLFVDFLLVRFLKN
jgi:hypothetical protein